VVREFADVFLDELSGMPPDKGVEFVIELQPGTDSYLQKTLPHATQGIGRIEDPISRVAR
jgi:hypothetical protein